MFFKLFLLLGFTVLSRAWQLKWEYSDGSEVSLPSEKFTQFVGLVTCQTFKKFHASQAPKDHKVNTENWLNDGPKVTNVYWEPDADSLFNAEREGLELPMRGKMPIYSVFLFGSEDCTPSATDHWKAEYKQFGKMFALNDQLKQSWTLDDLAKVGLERGILSFQLSALSSLGMLLT